MFKMASWPEKGNEPKAPDKFGQIGENLSWDISKVKLDLSDSATASRSDESQVEEKNSDVSNLDDGQLKALLDEAITYKCPKDREGKSNLFRELLQEVEADESKGENTDRGNVIQSTDIGGCRYITGSRRKNRRDDCISECQNKGGSLQNLVHALSSEFDVTTNVGYCTSGHVGGVSRRRAKKNSGNRDGVSVSARQREGGSLPSNVNVGGVQGSEILTLSGFELAPKSTLLSDESRNCCSKTTMSIKRKDKGNSVCSHLPNSDFSEPLHTNMSPLGDVPCHPVSNHDFMVIELGDFHISDDRNRTVQELTGISRHVNEIGRVCELQLNPEKKISGDIMGDKVCCANRKLRDDESVVETDTIQSSDIRTQVNYTTLATLEVGSSGLQECNGEADSSIRFPFPQGDRDDRVHYGMEQNPLQLTASYNSVKCIMGSSSTSSSAFAASTSTSICEPDQSIKGWEMRASVMYCTGAELYRKTPSGDTTKTSMIHPNVYPTHHLSVLSIPPNHTWITSLGPTGEGRLTFHGSKEVDTKCKSLDENGNAVSQACRLEGIGNNEKKSKQRRTKVFSDRNVIMSQNIEGHRGDKDIESLIKFIESDTESKGRNKHTSHNNGTLSLCSKQQRSTAKKDELGSIKSKRDGVHDDERGCKMRIQGTKQITKDKCSEKNKFKKSNSLEEISKSKIEDLMSFASADNNNAVTQVNLKNFNHAHLGNDFVAINKKYDSSRELCSENNNLLCSSTSVSVDEYFSSITTFSESNKWQISEDKSKFDTLSACREEGLAPSVQVEEMEFHVVTKKQRRKKRFSSSGGKSAISLFNMSKHSGTGYVGNVPKDFLSHQAQEGNGFPPHDNVANHSGGSVVLYQYKHHRPCSPEHHRRKSTSSMPPSEKSDSSDLDSVHSLPVSSTTPKLALDKTSTSSGSTPQASYADIARMAATTIVPVTGTCSNLSNARVSSINSANMTGFAGSDAVSSSATPLSSVCVSADSKISIGTPPVSGSKVIVVGNVFNPLSFSEEALAFSYSSETDKLCNQQLQENQMNDESNTALDYKLLSHHCVDNSGKSKRFELSQKNVLNDYYPSLEESLFVDKCEKKSAKICNTSFPARSLVSNLNVPLSSLVKKYVDIVCTDETNVVDVHAMNSENSLSTNVILGGVSSIKKTSKATEICDLKDNEKNLSRQLSLKLCIQESVFKIKSEVGNKVVPKEDCSVKAANYAQSVKLPSKTKELPESKNSRFFSYSSGKPPVILMNECLREELAFDSDLTFGFEINEQLLLSNGEDELCENPSILVREKSCGREKTESADELPPSAFSIETFLARFQKPHTHVTDDKIINFVGYAWNDIMKEASSADGKVQYYSGQ